MVSTAVVRSKACAWRVTLEEVIRQAKAREQSIGVAASPD
jgi:hypothetical protein